MKKKVQSKSEHDALKNSMPFLHPSVLEDIIIVPYQSDWHDLAKLAAMAVAANPVWTVSVLAQTVQAGCDIEIAQMRGQAVGFYVLDIRAGIEVELHYIVVLPCWRRYGIGRRLLQRAIHRAVECGALLLFLEVSVANDSAIALYQQLGFCKVGLRTGYYAMGTAREDACVMRLDLSIKDG